MADQKTEYSYAAVIEQIRQGAEVLSRDHAESYAKALEIAASVWTALTPNPSAVATAALAELFKNSAGQRPAPPRPRPADPRFQPPPSPYG